MDALELCQRAVGGDNIDIRRETNELFKFFEKIGEIVDMNLDYFPDMIVVTFVRHQDVVNALADQEPMLFKGGTLLPSKEVRTLRLLKEKIDFTCPVRNCTMPDDLIPTKFMPIYLH